MKVSDLEKGKWYQVEYKGPRKNRIMVAQYLYKNGENLFWSFRPLAGTSDMPWYSIVDIQPAKEQKPTLPLIRLPHPSTSRIRTQSQPRPDVGGVKVWTLGVSVVCRGCSIP